jgi:hypothetical protein
VKGVVPPIVATVCEYAIPTWPLGSDEVVIVNVFGKIVNVSCTAVVCAGTPASVTLKVTRLLTGFVGVPVICPVAALSVNPTGSRPALTVHRYGGVPPVAASVWEYGAPMTPPGSEAVVTANRAVAVIVKV